MMVSADILKVSTVGSQDEDERPITVDDNEEIESNHVQEGMVKSVPDSRIYRNDQHSPIQSQILDSVTSSSSVSTATHTSGKWPFLFRKYEDLPGLSAI